MKYRIVRTHAEVYVLDDVEAPTPEDAIAIAKNVDPNAFESVEQSAYEFEAIPSDKLL